MPTPISGMINQRQIIVQKFGGTSVANLALIKNLATKAAAEARYKSLVIVLSAMAGQTNEAVSSCLALSNLTTKDELSAYDSALSSFEVFSASLMSLAINSCGMRSVVLQGWQLPIVTDDNFSNARITEIGTTKLKSLLKKNIVPVICGFQGVTQSGSVTTLGRGGSDITAVAVAAALNANCCEIYTDVAGVFSADPRIIPQALHIPQITYEEMVCFSNYGAKVLERRSVNIAMQYNLNLKVLKSNSTKNGTTFLQGRNNNMEQPKVKGIALKNDIAFCTLQASDLSSISQILRNLNFSNLNLDHQAGICTFNIPLSEEVLLKTLLEKHAEVKFTIDSKSAYIAVVGWNVGQDFAVIEKILSILNETNISFLVEAHCIRLKIQVQQAAQIVKALHKGLIEES